MARRHYRPEEIMAKLREAEVLLGRGKKVAEVVKELGIHEVTYYRWRKEYGGMKVSQLKDPGSGLVFQHSLSPNTSMKKGILLLTLSSLEFALFVRDITLSDSRSLK